MVPPAVIARAGRFSYLLILAGFVLTRAAFYCAGGSFSYHDEINGFYQYLDVQQLKDNLWQSLLYMHIQPPLMNMMTGLSMFLFGEGWHTFFHLLFLGLGLALNLMLFRILKLLGVGKYVALLVVFIYMASPSQLLFEHFFFYMYPAVFLLVFSVWCVAECAVSGEVKWITRMAFCLALLCLLRSSYHLVVFAMPLVLFGRRFPMRTIMRKIAVPFTLVLLWYVKNLLIFGFFGSSSWMGMNVAKIAINTLTPPQQESLFVMTGDPLVRLHPFLEPAVYQPYLKTPLPAGPAVLTKPLKANGELNLNYGGYLEVSHRFAKLDLLSIQQFPKKYLQSIVFAYTLSLTPTSRYYLLDDNAQKISDYEDLYDTIVWLSPYAVYGKEYFHRFIASLTVLAVFPACWVGCLWRCYKDGLSRPPAYCLTLLYMSCIIIYCFIVGNMLEYGENNRFRFD